MATNGGRIDWTLGFKTDKTGLTELQKELAKISSLTINDLDKSLNTAQATQRLHELQSAAESIGKALQKSFNVNLNTVNVQKFTSEIIKTEGSVENLYKKLQQSGSVGQATAAKLTKEILTTNSTLHKTETTLDKIGTTLKNTLKWSISSSLINNFAGAFQQAYGYVQHLDTSLNDIRIVTGKSADEMDRFAQKANTAAKALGQATTDYTEASLIYYQQGLSDEEVKARTETTLKAANVTGQTTREVSEQLTAVWNGYRVSAENTEEAVDKLAAVAATTASDLEELSTGMSKVAAAANSMGVDMDQLNATIATIESVTRQAPESVGTALKTIYARMGDLQLGEADEDNITLGSVSGTLEQVGIHILDVNGDLRDMGIVIEEIGEKWNTWTKAEQTAIAEAVAGKRQYNNLFALFENWDMYTKALETSRNSTGKLQEQQDIYMESTAAHIQQLKTQWEDLYDSVLDTDTINTITDGITKILELVTDLIDALGGGKTLLLSITALVGQLVSKGLSKDLTSLIANAQNNKAFIEDSKARIDYAKQMGQYTDSASKEMKEMTELYGQYLNYMDEEQIKAAQSATARLGSLATKRDALKEEINEIEKANAALENNNKALNDENIKLEKNIQLEKESAAQRIKMMEAAMGSRGLQNETGSGRRRSDKTQNFNITDIVEKWNSSNAIIQTIQRDLDRMSKSATGALDTIEKIRNINTKSIGSALGLSEKELSSAQQNIDKLKMQLTDLYEGGFIDFNKFQRLHKVLEDAISIDPNTGETRLKQPVINALYDIENAAKQTKAEVKDIQTSLTGNSQAQKEANAQIEENTQKTEDNTQAQKKNEEQINRNKGAIEGYNNTIAQQKQALQDALNVNALQASIEGYSDLGNAALSAFSAFNMLTNSIERFSEGEVSLSQLMPAIISSIFMASRGVSLWHKALEKLTAAKLKDILTTAAETNQTIALDTAQKQATASALKLRSALGLIGLGITALIFVYQQISKHREELKKQREEEYQDTIKTIDATQEEINKNFELVDSYKSLITQYREGQISAEDFNARRKELLSTADLEVRKALEIADSWESASKALDQYASQQYEETIKAQTEKRDKGLEYLGISIQDLDQMKQDYQKMSDDDSRAAKRLKPLYQEVFESEAYQDIQEATKELNQASISKAVVSSGIEYAQSLEDISKAQKIFIESLQDTTLTTEEMFRAWDNALVTSGSDIAKKQGEINANAAFMIQDWMTNFGNVGGDVFNSERWKKALDISQMLEEAGLSEGIALLDEEAWKNLFGLSDSEIQEAVSTAIANQAIADLKIAKDKFNEDVQETSSSLGNIISKAISEDLTAEDEGYQALAEQFEILKQIIPELTDEIEVFNNEGLIGTEHWLNAVYKLQSSIDKLEYDKLIETRREAFDKLQLAAFGSETSYDDRGFLTSIAIEPDDSAFQEAMDDIMNAEYSIDVEVHSDAERDFTQLVDSLEQADEMASKIGEDFIVAADDIRDLNNTFPGILEGIEYLGDGTVKLNEDIVKSAMDAATQEEEADTQKTIAKLQNAATELRAKAETYEAMADIAHKAASQEIDSEQAKTDITAKLNELESENDQIAANTEIDNAVAVADNSQYNAKINADNWIESYQEAAKASYEFAQTAVANAAAAAAGPDGVPQDPGNFGFTYKGNIGNKASEAHKGQFKTTADGGIDWSATEQVYRDMAEAARAKANDIEGMMVGAAAKATEVLKNNADAKLGRPKKDSGSGGSEKEADHEDYLEREEDIYRTINEELEQIESTLGRIQTINDHEWGIDAQKTLEAENELLDKQLDKLKQKQALHEKDLSVRRKQLEDVGITFTEDGSAMTNAEAKLNAFYAHYNSMVDAYNAMSAAEQETYKAQLDAEKDRIDKIEQKIDDYESGFSDYQSTLDALLDAHYAEIENEVKLFNNMVDVHLELNDAKKEWDDFWYDVVQDVQDTDFGGQIAKSMAKLETLVGNTISNTDSDVSVLTNHLLDTIAEVQAQIASKDRGGEDSLFGDDTAASKENLENYRDKLMEALTAAKDEIDNISETYLKMLDDAQDKIDKQVDGWNSIGDQIDHDLELIKLISGEKAFAPLNNFLEQQYKNDLNLINTQKQSQDFWRQQIDRYTELLNVIEEGTVQWKTYSEALEKASENYRKAVSDLDKTVEEALKHLDEWRENQVNAITNALDNAMSGGLGLDLVEQEWKLINEYSEKYLDNVERALDMEEYTNILNDAAEATGLTAANQEKLNRFRDEELKKLNAKEKLTSYDIEESKARLEILKQELALEDARQNKSNMRLRRDSQGNYVYQYVSNEEDIEKANNGLLTAKREWYELVKKRYKETSDWIIDLEKQQASLLQQIDEAEKNGEIENANKLREIYKANEQAIVDAYAEAEKNKQDLYLGTAQYFDYVDNAAILPTAHATVRQLINEWIGGSGKDGFVTAVSTAITELEKMQDQYAQKTAVILTEAGINYQKLKENGVDPTIDSLEDLVDTNEELSYALEDINDLLDEQQYNLYQCEMAYYRLRDAAVNAVYSANSALNQLAQTAIATAQRVQAAIQSAQNAASIASSITNTARNLGSGVGNGISNRTTPTQTYTTKAIKNYYVTTNGVGGYKLVDSSTGNAIEYWSGYGGSMPNDAEALAYFQDRYKKYSISYLGYDRSRYMGFDTGGYTGEWGNSGKLAMLHQKELVLNQTDTSNMLQAVELLRDMVNNQGNIGGIADMIIKSTASQAAALAQINSSLLQHMASMVTTSNISNSRNMTVNADFSGVRSADAIYQALMELQNYGLQQNYSVDPMSSTPY